ncbi:MAG: hypothetical protein KAS17_04640, partial [Victivallaceae bacterium]|nr:hypothetical protein [Victivallaceae bacterium]
IWESIKNDLDNYALMKKKMRIADKEYEEYQKVEKGEVLFDMSEYASSDVDLELKTGRPRMSEDMVFF